MLAALYWIIDVRGWRRWCWFLVVVGMNSIAMYMMSQLFRSYTRDTLKRHLGLPYEWLSTWLNAHLHFGWPAEIFGGVYGPIFEKTSILLIFWLVCVWLYRQKIFIRI
jgi:predicted acyltransferase